MDVEVEVVSTAPTSWCGMGVRGGLRVAGGVVVLVGKQPASGVVGGEKHV